MTRQWRPTGETSSFPQRFIRESAKKKTSGEKGVLRELSDVRESTFSWRRKPKYAGVRMFVPLPAPSKANAAAVVVLFNRYLPSSSSSSSSFPPFFPSPRHSCERISKRGFRKPRKRGDDKNRWTGRNSTGASLRPCHQLVPSRIPQLLLHLLQSLISANPFNL